MLTSRKIMGLSLFKFFGQTELDTWKMRDSFEDRGWTSYSNWLVEELPFCLQRIRELADAFPFWQRWKSTGRWPHKERTLMICYLVRQLLRSTFRQTEGLMRHFKGFFSIQTIPDHTTLSRMNRTKRWRTIWKRFHRFVLDRLPERKTIVATDGTGFSAKKRGWKETPYPTRVIENWVKLHASIEVDSFLVLSYRITSSDVHESRPFCKLWVGLPQNITPIQSLADAAYTSEDCITVVKESGATPYHAIKRNARYKRFPETNYEKMVNFAIHWPNRFQEKYAMRAHAETAFSSIGERFGHRLRCRSDIGRINEVQTKICMHNIRMLAFAIIMNNI